ncbi:hypothetical protein PanWU01x14_329740 [Parasponia andersonii]|uniref:Uncharacterized protein n=1 Tax=Parasponia andersonii TaxID=3476 RepID=A0A2P5AIB6_PARAD|nr:hypothetical protein PanWU01x14_329740 [Parasponia andersonii]
MHEHQYLQSRVLFARAHPGASSERDKGVRGGAVALESGRVEFLGLWEVSRVLVGRVGTPVELPPLWDGEAVEDEVGEGFPESALQRRGQAEHFLCHAPRVLHLLKVIPVQQFSGCL